MQWPHVLGLMGDASDNVPGVKGIGPKGALTLIQQYGTIEGVLENAAEVSTPFFEHPHKKHEFQDLNI